MELKRSFVVLILLGLWIGVLFPAASTAARSSAIATITPGQAQSIEPSQVPVGLSAADWSMIQERMDQPESYYPWQDLSTAVSVNGSPQEACYSGSACLSDITYSLTVTPSITPEIKKLIAFDGMKQDFAGNSVSISGDTLVVGAPQEVCYAGSACLPGAVYIFYGNQNGEWAEVQKITPFDGRADDFFGGAVAIDGDTLVVGAGGADVSSEFDTGAVYVYYRNQGGADAWGLKAKFVGSGHGDLFGYSVSISGDTIVVGAVYNVYNYGYAEIFERNRGGPDFWGRVKRLTPLNGAPEDKFGGSVSIDGDTVVVGDNRADVGTNQDQGAAYVFYRNQGGADNWGQVQKLTAADGTYYDTFGRSVSIRGDTLVVGAPYANWVFGPRGHIGKGAAYVFYRNQGGADNWRQVQKLMTADATESDWFGNLGLSVSVNGDTIVAGAPAEACGSACQPGAAYLFCRNEGGVDAWGEVGKLIASDGVAYDNLGTAVSVSGETVMAGAPFANIGNNTLQGAVYSYTGCKLPLVFIHGMAGSRIVDRANNNKELWPGLLTGQSPLSLFVIDNPSPSIGPFEPIRDVRKLGITLEIVYGPLLDALSSQGGFREYRVDGDLRRQTTAGCDMTQLRDHPSLFTFTYDWRYSNVVAAQQLKDYIGCVQQFYPNTKVNILAHSNGGLVARRYILDNSGTHNVNALITIGTPWLGAPKAPYILETGDFVPHVTNKVIRYIVGSFTGTHELIASRAWYDLGGAPPIVERGYDLNGSYDLDKTGNAYEAYDYEMFIKVLDSRYGYDRYKNKQFNPGTASRNFHTAAQDDWHSDTPGIQYHHIYGYQLLHRTITQVEFSNEVKCSTIENVTDCVWGLVVAKPVFFEGDGTVPLLSAQRLGNGKDYNAPTARLYPITNSNADLAEHTGLCRNPEVIGLVFRILRDPTISAASASQTQVERPLVQTMLAQVEPAHYLTIDGAASVVVSDALGNNTAPIEGSEAWHGAVPGVDMFSLGDRAVMAILPTAQPFTVTFTTAAEPLMTEIRTGTGTTTTGLIRYQDLVLPAGVPARLTITPQGIDPLRYDGDGDGVFETTITPAIAVSGTTALDIEPPRVKISATTPQPGATDITISATDAGVGVKRVLYSIDGVHFSPYTSTFRVATCQATTVYAFADDHLLNRSSLVAKQLPCSTTVYLPIIQR